MSPHAACAPTERRLLLVPHRRLNVLNSALSVNILQMGSLRAAAALPVHHRIPAHQHQPLPTTRSVPLFVMLVYPELGQALAKSLVGPAQLVRGAQKQKPSRRRHVSNVRPEATATLSAARRIVVVWRVRWDSISRRAVSKSA